jgi:hypothetical protein
MSTIRFFAIALMGAAAIACGDDDDAPSNESVSGTWSIAKFEYVNAANTAERVDLVAQGLSGTVNLNDNGQYTATTTEPGFDPETVTGTWSYTADTFSLTETGNSFTWVFNLDVGDDVLTLTGADTEFDFDGDDVPEPATWNITLERL